MKSRKIRNILVLRFRRIGDAVISSALCSSLKRSFPEAKVDYVLNENIADLFEGHPDIDRLITFSEVEMHNYFEYIIKVAGIMFRGKYDIIIDTRSTVKTLWFSLFSLFTPYRIGHKKFYNYFLHNYRISSKNRYTEGELSYMLDLLKPLEGRFEIRYDRDFRIYVQAEEKDRMRKEMEGQGIDFNRPVVFCSVAVRDTKKAWNPSRMANVLKRMLERYENIQMVFNYSGSRERENAAAIADKIGDKRIFMTIEARNLKELAALLSNCDFLFGNEGGARHIAQALGIPSFAVYSPYAAKSIWLPDPSEKYRGIEYRDLLQDSVSDKNLSAEEKYDLIDEESVWNALREMADPYFLPKSAGISPH